MTTSERKSRKIYYTMGEVSEMFDVNPSLIRFWEQKFDILKPDKNKKGNRLFTPKDVENLKLIYHLVKENGMTLAGAAKRLRQNREGVSRDLEIIEKLQRVRSLLLDVREVLKADDDGREVFVDPAPADWDDVPASEYGMKSGGEPADNRMSEESSPRGEAIDDRAWPITDTPLRREADNSKPDSGEGHGAALVCEPRCAEVPEGLSELVYPLPAKVTTQATTTLGEVRRPKYPANLIELGYHDNYDDARWIENNLDAAAQAIARGLTEYFGLPFIYPQLVRTGVVTTEGSALRLRSYPGIDGEIVGSIPNGESVQVYGSFQGWYSVGYDDQLGYAAQAYIAV